MWNWNRVLQAPSSAFGLHCTALLDLYDLFEMKMNFVGRSKTASGERESRRFVARDYQSSAAPCGFKPGRETFRHTFYYNLFYPAHSYKGRQKRVTENVNELLTPRRRGSLRPPLYWFNDDGNSFQNGRNRAYRFLTHSFPLSDQALDVQGACTQLL